MWVYHRNPFWSWEDYAADSLAGLFILAAIVAAAVAVTIAIVIFREIGRIYVAHATHTRGNTANILWINLAVLVAGLIIAAALGSNPATANAAVTIAGLSWCVFLIVAEGCDAYEQQAQQTVRATTEPQLV